MSPLWCVFVFATILSQVLCEIDAGSQNRSIRCNDIEIQFDSEKAVGFWFEVAYMTPKTPPTVKRNPCLTTEFIALNRINSTDLIFKINFDTTYTFRNVDFNGTSGCYQRVKNLDDRILDIRTAVKINTLMTQFHLVETPKRTFLVQVVWETKIDNQGAIIYKKFEDKDVLEEELEPVFDFVQKLRGPQENIQFCISNDINAA